MGAGTSNRLLPFLVTFVLPGFGHVLLGRWRRGAVWFGAVLAALLAMALLGVPALVAGLVLRLAAPVDTLFIRPGPRPRDALVAGAAVAIIVTAIGTSIIMRVFLLEAFKIPSGGMIPTLQIGDHLLVKKSAYGLRIPFTDVRLLGDSKPGRGDVVVFVYPPEPDKDFIKRVVALEGDAVAVRDGVLHLNGAPVPRTVLRPPGKCVYSDYDEDRGWYEYRTCREVEEVLDGIRYRTVEDSVHTQAPYPRTDGRPCPGMMPAPSDDACIVPPGTVFVMGDNRSNSHDSRFWGPVPIGNIKGRAAWIWWSSGDKSIRWDRVGQQVE